jgi:hypothetical protein
MPIVKPSIAESCLGKNGNSQKVKPKTTAKTIAQVVLVRKRLASLSTLAITRRPSLTISAKGNQDSQSTFIKTRNYLVCVEG